MEKKTKPCPYCGETIQSSAVKCRHCGEWLNENIRKEKEAKPEPAKKKEKSNTDAQNMLFGCLLIVAFYAVPVAIVGFILNITIPNDSRMERAIVEDVHNCVVDEAKSYAGFVSDELSGFANLLLSNNASAEVIEQQFNEHNSIEIKRSWFWSVGKIHNAATSEGNTVCFGICGIVIPFVAWEDFILTDD
ncbi:MAG: zinc ribbon domain-containing protein [Prevotellaceae bacterium]|nr:zinc ribbon domain-containing protein [Prevotellaceae bacterium]